MDDIHNVNYTDHCFLRTELSRFAIRSGLSLLFASPCWSGGAHCSYSSKRPSIRDSHALTHDRGSRSVEARFSATARRIRAVEASKDADLDFRTIDKYEGKRKSGRERRKWRIMLFRDTNPLFFLSSIRHLRFVSPGIENSLQVKAKSHIFSSIVGKQLQL